jgi:hypothetical protein
VKPLVKARIPFNEMVVLADTLLAAGILRTVPGPMCQPDFDEISQLVDRMVKERLEDEVWVNVRRHLISFRKLLYSGCKEVEPLSLRAVRVSTRKVHFYAKKSRCQSR